MLKSKKQIIKFLRTASTYADLPVKIKFFTDKSDEAYGACTWTESDRDGYAIMCLEINTHSEIDIRETLLHELGHFELDHFDSYTPEVKCEFDAQMWAANRAKELGWTRIAEGLIKRFAIWRSRVYWWNTPYRRYILAGRLAEKKKII